MAEGSRSDASVVALLHIGIEFAFANVPVFIIGALSIFENGSLYTLGIKPDVTFVACVLYGLTIARFVPTLSYSRVHLEREAREQAVLWAVAMVVLPLFGIIGSSLLIMEFEKGPASITLSAMQVVNYAVASVLIFVLGGYGVRQAHLGEQPEQADA